MANESRRLLSAPCHAVVLGVVVTLCLVGCGSPEPTTGVAHSATAAAPRARATWPRALTVLRYGVTPYAGENAVRDSFEPVTAYLGKRLGVPIELVVGADYNAVGELLIEGRVDVSAISPYAYVLAKAREPRVQILATQLTESNPTYVGYVVVRALDAADTLEDLEGRSICWVDRESASGYLYPRALLRERGLEPERMFSFQTFAGDHPACLQMVLDGEVDAAATYGGGMTLARRLGMDTRRLRIIAKTRPIPDEPHCARPGLPAAAIDRLRSELLALSNRSADGRDVLRNPIRLSAWIPGNDSLYDGLRDVLAATVEAESLFGDDVLR